MTEAIVSSQIVTPEGIRPGAVLVDDGKVTSLVDVDAVPPGYRTVACAGALLPGLVDSHIHINEPGRTEWEGFATATRAAAAGGYTTLIDMPLNCLPATTTVAALEAKRAAAKGQCLVDWAAWGGVSGHNTADIEPLAAAGVRGFKCFLAEPGIDGFFRVDEAELRGAAPHLARAGLPLLVHAELPEFLAPIDSASDPRRSSTWLRSRPDRSEVEAIRLMIGLCREFGFSLHIVHLVTAQALDDIRRAKNEGLPITVETCPHYLRFAAEDIPDGSTLHKCAPPIRSAANREQLWEAIREGVIDLIATDHSPCPPAMKCRDTGDFVQAWGGIASVSVALSVVWSGMRGRGFTLADLARLLSQKPAQIGGLGGRKGRIAAGYDADFVVFNPEATFTVKEQELHTRHSISPYLGETLFGTVTATYLRGEPVFKDGRFTESRPGREIAR
ncbi:MAG TPA: allantoinase AllB [Acidobacteriaceae bacterium]|jgi:allantoinase|nr:allantoinase AllB [Acidobacteriaceae bacterium]